jgi:hypothetical protein
MAAGQGFKTFTSGEVLTAADVNGYLMQGVGVFTDAANRDAEITSPQEGQFAFLKDTNVTTYYTGSAWANLDTTGMTNPMTTTGDTIYSSSGSTPARLGIGTAGQVLQVNSGATAPEWATPAGGVTFSGCQVTQGSAQSIANASIVTLNFNTETFDVDGYHDNVTNNSRLTVPAGKTGYFLIHAKLNMTANATGSYQGLITKNGGQIKTFASKNNTGINGEPSITFVASGVPTDYFEFKVYQDQGTSLDTISGTTATTFGITYLGA